MTLKEAIEQLKYQRAMFNFDPMTGEVGLKDKESREGYEACTMAIRSLEAWKSMRDEIGNLKVGSSFDYGEGVRDCWRIINKYLSEVEGERSDN